MRVDFHFHPNFPIWIPLVGFKLSSRKAKSIWKAFSKHNLSAVIITEHAYKRPKTSFEILEAHKPASSSMHIFPGLEALTKEGIDTVVFARKKEDIYCHKELLTPKSLTIEELIDFVENNSELYGMITHPATPGLTGMLRRKGKDFTLEASKRFGMLEAYNCSNAMLQNLLEITKFKVLSPKKYQQMRDTKDAPLSLRLPGIILTGGSDAHHTWEIGDYMDIPNDDFDDSKSIFNAIISQQGIFAENKSKPLSGLIVSTGTVLLEWSRKKFRWYTSDIPYDKRIFQLLRRKRAEIYGRLLAVENEIIPTAIKTSN